MNVQEIINTVEEFHTDKKYWFIRTDQGLLFDDFMEGNYVAIGWDYISLLELELDSIDEVKNKIATVEQAAINTTAGKSKISGIYNKIKTFYDVKKDDIVLIPSSNSSRIAFGRITDDKPYEETTVNDYRKRRKVEWINVKSQKYLNPTFHLLKKNQHSISSIHAKTFSKYIDREIGKLFRKKERTHYVLNIDKDDDINFNDLKSLIDNLSALQNNIVACLGLEESENDLFVKVSLQSRGSFELIKKGNSLPILAYLLFLTSCGNLDNVRDNKIQELIDSNKEILNQTKKDIDSLEINIDELIKPFEGGN